MSAEAFVIEASLALDPACDPRAPGGAVTVELCGHWDHEGPCRWPHNSALDDTGTFRTVFVADRREASTIAQRIEHALRSATDWDVTHVTDAPSTITSANWPTTSSRRLARSPELRESGVRESGV